MVLAMSVLLSFGPAPEGDQWGLEYEPGWWTWWTPAFQVSVTWGVEPAADTGEKE